jgi:hypothetical protein
MSRTTGGRRAVVVAVIFAAAALAPGPGGAEVPNVDIAVVVNPQNRAAVSPAELENIFLLRTRQWPDGTPIIPFNFPPGEAHRVSFDRTALRMTTEEAARYWLDQRIRSGTRAPRQITDAALAARLVSRLKGAVAYVPINVVSDSVRVVARIRGGKVLPP